MVLNFCALYTKNRLWVDQDSDWEEMDKADTGDLLYDDAMQGNTKSQDSIDFITYHF